MFNITGPQLDLWIASVLWPFLRVLAMLSAAPIFDNRAIPRRVRVGLSLIMAVLLAQVLPAPPPLSHPQALVILIQQLLVGVALGFSMKLVFSAFEMAGDKIGLSMGLAFAQFVDPSKGSQSPLVGSFLNLLASLVFLSMDGHLMVLTALIKTFEVVPIGTQLDFLNGQVIALAGSQMFLLSLQITMPVLTALLICNIILGILTRAAPQLNVMSVGFAITIGAGLWILLSTMPYFIYGIDGALSRMMSLAIFKTN